MGVLDIIIIVPIAWLGYKGFTRGFVLEVFSLLALFAGIYAGIHFSDYAAGMITENMQIKSEYVPILSFVVTFLAVLFAVYYLGKIVEKVLKIASLEFFNKLAGALFGILKGALIMSVLLIWFQSLNMKWDVVSQEKLDDSVLFDPVKEVSLVVFPAIRESKWYQEIRELDIREIISEFKPGSNPS